MAVLHPVETAFFVAYGAKVSKSSAFDLLMQTV